MNHFQKSLHKIAVKILKKMRPGLSKQCKPKLQAQIKRIIKRKISTSSEEDLQMYNIKQKLRAVEKQLETYKKKQSFRDEEIVLQPQETQEEQPLVAQQVGDDEDDSDDNQLYGGNHVEKMISIGNNVYCRKIIYDMALGASHKASHVARKLLEGVFKKEILLKATLTGQSPRAQGIERQQKTVVALCVKARTTIIDFSKKTAFERGWEVQTVKDIERAMSQRIGEIKRQRN